MSIEKKELRQQLVADINALPEEYIKESNEGLFNRMIELPAFKEARVIFTYYSFRREPDTLKLIDYTLKAGKTVTFPVCFKGGVMEARAVSSVSELAPSSYGLMEPSESTRVFTPEELDFIIVPALAYDRQGYRLGWGGGYYDRFLVRTNAFKAGVARERLLREKLPHDKYDVPVDCIVTERKARLQGGASLKSG